MLDGDRLQKVIPERQNKLKGVNRELPIYTSNTERSMIEFI